MFKEEGCKRFCFSFDKEDGLTRDETLQKYNGMLRTIKILLPNFEFDKISFLGTNFSHSLSHRVISKRNLWK